MIKKSLGEIIEKMAVKPILASLLVFGVFFILIVGFSVFKYGYSEKFFENIVIEAHGMLFDILIIGVFIFALHRVGEKRLKKELEIERYNDEIDDFRGWDSEEAKFRIVGNIKRLNRNGITDINLIDSFLKNAILSRAHLEGANLEGANLERAHLLGTNLEGARLLGANLEGADLRVANLERSDLLGANLKETDFRRTNLKEADLSRAHLEKAYLREAHLKGADFWKANLKGANLLDANLEEANLEGANLERTEELTIGQLSQVKTLYQAELDPELEKQIKKKYPHLLEKPKEEDRDKRKPDFSDLLD